MGFEKIAFGQMRFVINPYTTGFFVSKVRFGEIGFGEMGQYSLLHVPHRYPYRAWATSEYMII